MARVYDFLFGGKDNYEVDRAYAEELLQRYPAARVLARENRYFVLRAVRYLAGEAGISQFIDIGAGLPAVDNVHEVAVKVNPDAHVVYVDNDPMVVTHGRALLTEEGRTTLIAADMCAPHKIMAHPDTGKLIDFSKPVAVLFASVLHFQPDDIPARLLRVWRSALPPGSHLVISHALRDPALAGAVELCRQQMATGTPRSEEEIADLFDGFTLVDPGLVSVPLWRPDHVPSPGADVRPFLGGVGLLP